MPLAEIKRYVQSRKKYLAETKERYWQVTDDDKQRMVNFANKITPSHWNVWSEDDSQVILKRGYLNILLFAKAADHQGRHEKGIRGSVNARGIEYLHGIGRSNITVYPHMGDWPGTIIHELAHLAVDRRLSLTKKTYNEPEYAYCTSRIFHIDDHGALFDRAIYLLRMRLLALHSYAYVLRYLLMNPMKIPNSIKW